MPSARRVKWAKFRITVVTFAALVVMGTLFYLLTGGSLFQPTANLYLYLPDATGLEKDAPVRVDGVGVGKVTAVALSGSRMPGRIIKVTLTVNHDRLASIPTDSFAQLSSDSLIGDKFVDVTSGTLVQSVAAGSELQYKNAPELMKSLDLTQFTEQLRLIDATLTDLETGRSPFGAFVQGTEFYNDLMKNMQQLHSGFHDMVAPTSAVGSLLTTDALHRQLEESLLGIDHDLSQIQAGQGPIGTLLHDSSAYDQTLEQIRKMRSTVSGLRASPLFQSDDAYKSWNQQLAVWIRNVDDLNAAGALNGTSPYETLNGAARELEKSLRDFRQNPRKYMWMKLF